MPRQEPNLGFLPWFTVQCGLPHSRPLGPDGNEVTIYTRTNGRSRLVILADLRVGLPYGKIPRLLLAYLVAQYKRNRAKLPPEQARYIDLGPSCRWVLRALGLDVGRRGYACFYNQATRLLTSDLQTYDVPAEGPVLDRWSPHEPIAEQARLWRHQNDLPSIRAPHPEGPHPYTVALSPRFARACEVAVPVSLDTMAALRSPFAIDLYTWLSYRCAKLHQQGRASVVISWDRLQAQFGHTYRRRVDFKRAFRLHLRTVLDHYPARVDHQSLPQGIVLYAAPPHVARRTG